MEELPAALPVFDPPALGVDPVACKGGEPKDDWPDAVTEPTVADEPEADDVAEPKS